MLGQYVPNAASKLGVRSLDPASGEAAGQPGDLLATFKPVGDALLSTLVSELNKKDAPPPPPQKKIDLVAVALVGVAALVVLVVVVKIAKS